MSARFWTGTILSVTAVLTMGGASDQVVKCRQSAPCLVERNFGKGPAILAVSDDAAGVSATSGQSVGVFGGTFDNANQNFNIGAGVYGADESSDPTSGDFGVVGSSTYGDGIVGITYNPSKTDGMQGDAIVGVDYSDDFGLLNVAVQGIAYGTGVEAVSLEPAQPAGSPQYPALSALCTGGSLAMLADNGYGSPGGDVMSLDCAGNMILKGTVMTDGTPLARVRSSSGPAHAAYATLSARPAIEDAGEGRIADGSGHVAIDATFARSIDSHSGYSVFVTPEGPSAGLYVTNKSASGFDVRENPGGHATIGFAYRVVATPFGESAVRLPEAKTVVAGLYREAEAAPHSRAALHVPRARFASRP